MHRTLKFSVVFLAQTLIMTMTFFLVDVHCNCVDFDSRLAFTTLNRCQFFLRAYHTYSILIGIIPRSCHVLFDSLRPDFETLRISVVSLSGSLLRPIVHLQYLFGTFPVILDLLFESHRAPYIGTLPPFGLVQVFLHDHVGVTGQLFVQRRQRAVSFMFLSVVHLGIILAAWLLRLPCGINEGGRGGRCCCRQRRHLFVHILVLF